MNLNNNVSESAFIAKVGFAPDQYVWINNQRTSFEHDENRWYHLRLTFDWMNKNLDFYIGGRSADCKVSPPRCSTRSVRTTCTSTR